MQELAVPQKSLIRHTYAVTIAMLVIGQIQVAVFMQIKSLKDFLARRYFLSLIQFFVSFLSIQLYVFFFHIISGKSMWVRVVVGMWTYQVNTISIMKPAMKAPYLTLAVSFVFTYWMMFISAIYGYNARHHKRGLFVSRHNVILWSERIFVVTCFGIIVCDEMANVTIEFLTLLVYTLMSNVFVVIFAASLRRPNFYHPHDLGDFILIGQLYYLNYFALYMSIVWTLDVLLDIMEWDTSFFQFFNSTTKAPTTTHILI
ncbi:uncharacterized protein [Drosophila kikkawai]|uniref:Uncharacterized protein n=1 Tax=Drosophila kikkawai TaxID=30033 RepID=A0A6P4IKJ6_DROKI|nr:uncharacterized protein LOC108079175 [Drosophila kikkawai]